MRNIIRLIQQNSNLLLFLMIQGICSQNNHEVNFAEKYLLIISFSNKLIDEAANEISKSEFNLELCQLDSLSLKELKRKFRFTLLIKKELPIPPPPPEGLLEIEVVTTVTEFEK